MRSVLVVACLACVTALAGADATGAAPERSARIVYEHGTRIALMNADGSGRTTLAGGAGLVTLGPDWSPGGDAIAFTQQRSRGEGPARLYRIGADGRGLRRLTRAGRHVLDASPAWRPDGRRIAFVRFRFGRSHSVSEIRTVGANGGGGRLVYRQPKSNGLTAIGDVTWGPHASALAFTRITTSRTGIQRPSLWRVAAAGGKPRLLARHAQDAAFSPDGARIAFSDTRDHARQTCGSDECSFNGDIYLMNADGSGKRQLTRNHADDAAPAWSPDGQRIAFSSDRNYEEYPEVYSIRPDGSCLTWLTNGTPDSTGPAWEPGATRSSSPGPCGDHRRPPVVGVSVARARRFHRFPVWWLGKRTLGGLLLDYAFVERRGAVGFTYSDCGRWSPARCAPPLPQFDNESACSRRTLILHGNDPRQLRRLHGTLAYRPRGYDWPTQVYAGRTVISLGLSSPRRVAAFAPHLRRLGAGAPPRHLPRAGFSRRVWRRYDRAARAARRTGSVRGAARAMHLSRAQVRDRLAMRRKLRRFGARRLHC